MYKKSITRIEKENESSQVELSNAALHDIIATNHIMLAKKPHKERLSRACKAVIIMIILGLVAIGIVVLTLVLAHSRNTLMAITSRSGEANYLSASNNSRIQFVNQENLTTISNEKKEDDNWQKTTVSLTSNNLHRLTTQNVHISSSIMRTQQRNKHISFNTQSMKPYPSSNTIVNEQSTISTTIQTIMTNQQTTFIPSSHYSTIIMTAENETMTAIDGQDYTQTSSANEMATSVVDNTAILIQDNKTSIPEETSFTTLLNRHFNFQSSTIVNKNKNQRNQFAKNFTNDDDEDIMNDVLFS